MKRWIKHFSLSLLCILGISCQGKTQLPENLPHSQDPKFDQTIIQALDFSIPVVSVDDLRSRPGEFVILEAREKNEFDVSRIPGAQWVGYDDFRLDRLKGIDKDQPVLLYCSIGYRSEKIVEKLRKAGFTQVYNLYGSIFEWGNRGYPLVNEKGEEVKRIHTYNRSWGKWVDEQKLEKVY